METITDSRPVFSDKFYGDHCLGTHIDVHATELNPGVVMCSVMATDEYKWIAIRWLESISKEAAKRIVSVHFDQGHAMILWESGVTRTHLLVFCGKKDTIRIPYGTDVLEDGTVVTDIDEWTVTHYNKY